MPKTLPAKLNEVRGLIRDRFDFSRRDDYLRERDRGHARLRGSRHLEILETILACDFRDGSSWRLK